MLRDAMAVSTAFVLMVAGWVAGAGEEGKPPADPNKPADYQRPKEGVFTGIALKPDGENRLVVAPVTRRGRPSLKDLEPRRVFMPRWIGGNPDQGGGFDKTMAERIREVKPGDRVEVKWIFDERFRVIELKVLWRAPMKEDKGKDNATP